MALETELFERVGKTEGAEKIINVKMFQAEESPKICNFLQKHLSTFRRRKINFSPQLLDILDAKKSPGKGSKEIVQRF